MFAFAPRHLPLLLLAALFGLPVPAQDSPRRAVWEEARRKHRGEGPVLLIVTPHEDATVWSEAVRFNGASEPGAAVSLNGRPLAVYPNGAFAGLEPLEVGRNRLEFRASKDGEVTRRTLHLRRGPPLRVLPRSPSAISDRYPIRPERSAQVLPGDRLEIRLQGSPGARAWARLGKSGRRIDLREMAVDPPRIPVAGIYQGFYEPLPGEIHADETMGLYLIGPDGETAVARAPGRVSTDPTRIRRLGHVEHDDAGIYPEPRRSDRIGRLEQGCPVEIVGSIGDYYRIRLGAAYSGFVPRHAIRLERWRAGIGGAKPPLLPPARLTSLTLSRHPESGESRLVLGLHWPEDRPSTGSLPERIEIDPESGEIRWTLWGVDSASTETVQAFAFTDSLLVKQVERESPDPETLRITLTLDRQPCWGYRRETEGRHFVLVLSPPPRLDPTPDQPLRGLGVVIDPGHGGRDQGAIGSAGLAESDINLHIARRLEALLERDGARVSLTRDDDRTLPPDERLRKIRQSEADLLVSIHNNSIDLATDPLRPSGLRMFYHHGNGLDLARTLHRSICREIGQEPLDSEVRTHGFRYVRRSTQLPGVLVEGQFLSHPEDEQRLLDAAFLDSFCHGIYKGLYRWLGREAPARPAPPRYRFTDPAPDTRTVRVPHLRATTMKRYPG